MRLKFGSLAFLTTAICVSLLFCFTSVALAVIDAGECGVDGAFWDWNFHARGTRGKTRAYSSMSPGQGKVNTFYVDHLDGWGLENGVEFGWSWLKMSGRDEGNAPLWMAACMQNNYFSRVRGNWFPAGSEHEYCLVYWGRGGYGQRWRCYFDGNPVCEVSRTWVVDGWSLIGSERTWNCSNNAEFWNCKRHNGTGWVWWSQPNNLDHSGFDTDPYYTCYRYPYPNGTSGLEVRPNGRP